MVEFLLLLLVLSALGGSVAYAMLSLMCLGGILLLAFVLLGPDGFLAGIMLGAIFLLLKWLFTPRKSSKKTPPPAAPTRSAAVHREQSAQELTVRVWVIDSSAAAHQESNAQRGAYLPYSGSKMEEPPPPQKTTWSAAAYREKCAQRGIPLQSSGSKPGSSDVSPAGTLTRKAPPKQENPVQAAPVAVTRKKSGL